MKYTDKIYGEIEIDEPVIAELIESAPLQRLKEVNQYGAAFYRFPHLTTTRFDHSVGVYYILKRLGASVQEQIVGLLHDAPHTAFSHVSDLVFEDASQTFHEKFHEKIIFESEIPKILKKHGISVWKLLNKKKFTLAEQDLPDLCADRIDYLYRDSVTDGELDLTLAREMLDDMQVVQGKIVFGKQDLARGFADTYARTNQKLWAHPLQSALYYLLASAMKLSLEEAVITFEDLFTTDKEVYDKMKESGIPEIVKYLDDMENVEIREDDNDYDYHIRPKVRLVDPYVVTGEGEITRLAALDEAFAERSLKQAEAMKRGYFVKVV